MKTILGIGFLIGAFFTVRYFIINKKTNEVDNTKIYRGGLAYANDVSKAINAGQTQFDRQSNVNNLTLG